MLLTYNVMRETGHGMRGKAIPGNKVDYDILRKSETSQTDEM